jgi:hypothetical protein
MFLLCSFSSRGNAVAATITFITVPFILARKGRLAPGAPQIFSEREGAIRLAETLSAAKAGVLVLEQESDAAADIYAEPRLIAHFGRIPEEMFQFT